MRIISGQRRGHKFEGPADRETRPTSDLVREALFNILIEEVDGRVVVDLFAGTGALGLEALSRGADRAVFVEKDRSNAGLIRRNLSILRYEDRGSVVAADAFRWARSYRSIDGRPAVVFVDPPWAYFEDRAADLRRLVDDLIAALPDESTLCIEAGRAFSEADLPDLPGWDLRRYGGTHVAIRAIGEATGEMADGVEGDGDDGEG